MDCGAWLNWQINYLLLLQNFRDITNHVFDLFFIYITTLGEVAVPIIVICALYWTVNKKIGQFVLWSYMFGFIVNQLVKTTACIYRPWILDSRIHPLPQAIPAATGYSFPSGHTAGAMSIWGGIAISFWKNKIIRYICFAIILCVMFSRNYLGVHTPQDVVVSFLLSCLVLYVTHKVMKWTDADPKRDKYILIAVFGIVFLSVIYILLKYYPIHYLFGKILYDPTPIKYDTIARSGFIIGAFIGWYIEKRHINFQPQDGTAICKFTSMVYGIVILYGLYSYTNTIRELISCYASIALTGLFLQHALIGLFITCIQPFLIKKFLQ